jgi:hypothetical protein
MTHLDLFATAVLLGLFVTAGGAYGILYGVSMLRSSTALARTGHACYALQLLIALLVCIGSPLALPWKVFVAASAIAYGFIPPLVWRLLQVMHHDAGEQPRPS